MQFSCKALTKRKSAILCLRPLQNSLSKTSAVTAYKSEVDAEGDGG
jgi:hypothetical protein